MTNCRFQHSSAAEVEHTILHVCMYIPFPHLAICSMTFFPSNLAMVSLSGMGSTEQDWMSVSVKDHTTSHTLHYMYITPTLHYMYITLY